MGKPSCACCILLSQHTGKNVYWVVVVLSDYFHTESKNILLISGCPKCTKEHEKAHFTCTENVILFTHYSCHLLSSPLPISHSTLIGVIPWYPFGRSALPASQAVVYGESWIHPQFQGWMVTQVWQAQALHALGQRNYWFMDGHVTQLDLASEIQVDIGWGFRKSGKLDFNLRACVIRVGERYSSEFENEANRAESREQRWR